MPRNVAGRCEANNVNGQRCKRRTAKGPLCYAHLASTKQLKIKKSGIPRTGFGLFTLKDIRKNQVIAPYGGIKITTARPYSGPYVLEIANNKYLDADPKKSNDSIGGYCNNCRALNKRAHQCPGNNTKFSPNQNRTSANLKASKNIKAGSELFASYGRKYGNQF